jgi:hypothetical protein
MERLFDSEAAGTGRRARRSGFRITERDRAIVQWIGRQRMVTTAQIAERFALGRAVSYARLSGLTAPGAT